MAGHAMRLAQGIDGIAVQIGDGVAHDLVGGTAIEFHIAGQSDRIGARLCQRLSDIARFEFCQCVGLRQHSLAYAGQDAATLCRSHPSPVSGAGGMGGSDSRVDIRRRAARDLRQGLACRWVRNLDRGIATNPGPADQVAGRRDIKGRQRHGQAPAIGGRRRSGIWCRDVVDRQKQTLLNRIRRFFRPASPARGL